MRSNPHLFGSPLSVKKPVVIGIGGAHSGVGKTTVAAALLNYFTRVEHRASSVQTSEEKSFPAGSRLLTSGFFKRWGAIKFTKTAFYSSVVDDPAVLSEEDKDTRKLLDAGAEEVLWVQAPVAELGETLPLAFERLSHLDGVLVEGNSAIEFLKPDIVIFIASISKEKVKASAQRLLHRADIVIIPSKHGAEKTAAPDWCEECLIFDAADGAALERLIQRMEAVGTKKNIEALLKEKSVDGRITCTIARGIAEELGVSYKEVGNTANELKIKIKNCELGCF
ncbi:MAG: hypothetical protein ACOYW7_00140 [Nitrospirota bacterium]